MNTLYCKGILGISRKRKLITLLVIHKQTVICKSKKRILIHPNFITHMMFFVIIDSCFTICIHNNSEFTV